MINTEELFKKIYRVFSTYPRPTRVLGSPISVASDADVNLITKPLKSLTQEDLQQYEFKAMSTWGTEEDYKYFLPVIMEANFYSFTWGSDIFFGKILSAGCNEDDERDVLEEYVLAMWQHASKLPWPNMQMVEDLIDYLDYFISKDTDELVETWIREWVEHESIEAFEELVSYINYRWVEVLYEDKPHYSFSEIVLESNFQERLQNAFFKYEKTNPQLANSISTCEKHLSDYRTSNRIMS